MMSLYQRYVDLYINSMAYKRAVWLASFFIAVVVGVVNVLKYIKLSKMVIKVYVCYGADGVRVCRLYAKICAVC